MFLALRCPSSQRALPKTIDSILNELKPEAAYFAEENGKRTGFIFFDLKDTSQIPAVAEPWFLVNAQVEFHPAMNLEDLKKATPGIEKAVKPMHLLVILFIALLGLDRCYSTNERDSCLAQTDILVLCVRLSDATRGMIGAYELACLPVGAYLVNVARGGLVDYDALYAALSSGRLAGVGLDVYWQEPVAANDPLLALPSVIATPHVAGVTDRSYGEIADAVALNIERLRHGEPPLDRAV